MKKRNLLLGWLLLAIAFPAFGQVQTSAQKTGAVTGSGSYPSYAGCFTMAVSGYGVVKIHVSNSGTAWSGTIQPETSLGGGSPQNVEVMPDPNTPTPQATITANGDYTSIVAGADLFLLCGNTVTNTAAVTANAVLQVVSPSGSSAGGSSNVTIIGPLGQATKSASVPVTLASDQGSLAVTLASAPTTTVTGSATPADAAATPTTAVIVQSWPMGWNGASSDRLRTASIGNGVAATGILAASGYGEFLTSLATLTNGQYGAVQLDAKGQTLADVNYVLGAIMSATNPLFDRLTDGTNAMTACFSAYGSAPTGTQCPGFNAAITNTPDVLPQPGAGSAVAVSVSSQSALTTAVVVKASSGNIYGFQVTNGAATACYLEFINTASAPSLGTNAVYSIQVSGTGTQTFPVGVYGPNFTTGLSVGMATTYNGSSACGTAATGVIFYK